MSKQRMRYQWWRDVPRNVTRREYEQWQWRHFGGLGLGAMAVIMALAAVTGISLRSARQLAAIETMTVAEALAYSGDRSEVVKLEGFLVVDEPLTMPDDEARQVIRGQLKIVARTGAETADEETADEEAAPPQAILYEWAEAAAPVFLSDGDCRLPLAFDLAILPMTAEAGRLSPTIVRTGESARTSRPVAIQYGDDTLPLPLESWGEVESVFTDLERQVLPQGQSAVVVAAVESTPQGNQLVDPLGDRLQVNLGTEQDIRQGGQQTRLLFAVLCVPFGFASFLLLRSAHTLHQEFVARSHQ